MRSRIRDRLGRFVEPHACAAGRFPRAPGPRDSSSGRRGRSGTGAPPVWMASDAVAGSRRGSPAEARPGAPEVVDGTDRAVEEIVVPERNEVSPEPLSRWRRRQPSAHRVVDPVPGGLRRSHPRVPRCLARNPPPVELRQARKTRHDRRRDECEPRGEQQEERPAPRATRTTTSSSWPGATVPRMISRRAAADRRHSRPRGCQGTTNR